MLVKPLVLAYFAAGLAAICAAAITAADEPSPHKFSIVLPAPEQGWLECDIHTATESGGRDPWEVWFGKLFDFFDVDHSGSLNAAERARAPDPRLLAAQLRGDFYNLPAKTVEWEAVQRTGWPSSRGELARAAFCQLYRQAGLASPETRIAITNRAGIATGRLLSALGGDDKARIGPAQFRDSERLLAPLDRDDDQRITWDELVDDDPAGLLPQAAAAGNEPGPGLHVVPGNDDQRPHPLGRVVVSLSEAEAGTAVVAQSGHERSPAHPPLAADGSAIVGGPGTRVWVKAARGSATAALRTARQSLLQQFEAEDANGDSQIDAEEQRASPSGEYWAALATIADRDADGQLEVGELRCYLDLLALAAGDHIALRAESGGRCLFEALDQDLDGRLSLRELQSGWKAIAAWDKNRNGTVEWEEIPRGWRLTFSIGQPLAAVPAASSPAAAPAGPGWFQALDVNHDGDVSRREFPGAADSFHRIDRDGDGLIDAREAEAARPG